MVIWTAKFSRKKMALLALLVLAVGLGVWFFQGHGEPAQASLPVLATNEERIAYLRDLGWEVEEEPVETLEFWLPETLEEPYLRYNALQIPQGFDLSAYCGQPVARYTYAVTNYPDRASGVQANLYLCGDIPVAGDILCPGANGFQEPLIQARDH